MRPEDTHKTKETHGHCSKTLGAPFCNAGNYAATKRRPTERAEHQAGMRRWNEIKRRRYARETRELRSATKYKQTRPKMCIEELQNLQGER